MSSICVNRVNEISVANNVAPLLYSASIALPAKAVPEGLNLLCFGRLLIRNLTTYLPQRLLGRIRYFTDGVILGCQDFVESQFARLKQTLGYRRHRVATHLTALGSAGLWVFRDIQVRVFDQALAGSVYQPR